LGTSDAVSEGKVVKSKVWAHDGALRTTQHPVLSAVYALALAVSVSLWFIAIRAPLWLDETGSFWQINGGFSAIWPRQGLCFPAYSYILWLWTKIAGTTEIALRVPSILAMLAAVYLLYCAARELFDREVGFIAAIVFCVHPIVIFAAIDVRPYAFGVLATNTAILALVRLRKSDSLWLAALFGFAAACTVWFHYLFVVIVPSFAICYFAIKIGQQWRLVWRQFGIALLAFVIGLLPVIPGFLNLFHGGDTHVFEGAPNLSELAWTLAPGWLPVIFGGAALVLLLVAATSTKPRERTTHWEFRLMLICVSLAMVPILILYGVSVGTSLHLFIAHRRLVAIPGIALCWALGIRLFRPRSTRLLLCIAVVAATAFTYFTSPSTRQHGYSWKYALEVAEKNASADDAPVLVCSDFREADFVAMPSGSARDSNIFAPLSYYRLTVPRCTPSEGVE
jgi:mannosyltransferase